MKNAKLLKSAVLSTALLFVGGAQAQSADGTATIIVQTATSVSVDAGALSFGTHNVPSAATNVVLSCFSGGVSNVAPAAVSGGNCGVVTISTSSGSNVTFNVAVTATDLTGGGNTLSTSAFTIYGGNGNSISTTLDQTVVSGTDRTFRVGGTVAVPASQAAGDYAGTYTFTATIS